MKLPLTYKSFLKLLIQIAEHGNDYKGEEKMTHKEYLEVGSLIADIQNGLGEMTELLEKFNLKYNG